MEKICALEPDGVGFIFWPSAKRYVRPDQIVHWINHIPDSIKKIGVFVEPSADLVETTARACHLDIVQIHLTSNDWKMDRPLFQGLEIWLSPRMDEKISPAILSAIDPEPTVLLADSFDPNIVGGTGKIGNWNRATMMKKTVGKPLMLAGGLNAKNVRDAIIAVQPWGVDVSSGVEKEIGVKDIRKAKKFLSVVRSKSSPDIWT